MTTFLRHSYCRKSQQNIGNIQLLTSRPDIHTGRTIVLVVEHAHEHRVVERRLLAHDLGYGREAVVQALEAVETFLQWKTWW